MVVEIADNVQMTRWWIEQTTPSVLAQRSRLVATSAASMPGIRPYYNPAEPTKSQLSGLIGGVMAAATYEILLGQPGRATGAVAAQSVAHVGLVFFLPGRYFCRLQESVNRSYRRLR